MFYDDDKLLIFGIGLSWFFWSMLLCILWGLFDCSYNSIMKVLIVVVIIGIILSCSVALMCNDHDAFGATLLLISFVLIVVSGYVGHKSVKEESAFATGEAEQYGTAQTYTGTIEKEYISNDYWLENGVSVEYNGSTYDIKDETLYAKYLRQELNPGDEIKFVIYQRKTTNGNAYRILSENQFNEIETELMTAHSRKLSDVEQELKKPYSS